MKKIFDYIPVWLLLSLTAVIALIFWPIIFIILGMVILFGNKSSDSEKVAGAKMVILTVIGLVVWRLIVSYQIPLGIVLDNIQALFTPLAVIILIIVLVILATLQKYFPNLKWLAKKSNKEDI